MGKKDTLKTIALAVKWDKLLKEKSGKSKQPKVARVNLGVAWGLHIPDKPEWKPSNEVNRQQPTSQKSPGVSLEGSISGVFIGLTYKKIVPISSKSISIKKAKSTWSIDICSI